MHIELSSELGSIRIRSALSLVQQNQGRAINPVAKEGTSDWRERGGEGGG